MRAEKLRIVSVFDPALMPMTPRQVFEYTKTREPGLVAPFIKPGSSPTWFTLREIEHGLWERYVMATDVEAEQFRRAFQCACVRVENLHQTDGTALPLWDAPVKDGAGMPDEMLARVSAQERAEIGRVAWLHSFFHRRIECSFVLPATFRELLVGLGFLSADVSPTSPAASSSDPSQPAASAPQAPAPTGPSSATTADGSGLPTGAIATGRVRKARARVT